jgi:hypothetical protein
MQSSSVTPPSVAFNYWEDSAAGWPQHLAALKAKGVDEIHTFIPWGVHESVQGIRDFSKASKLRLEKFLGHAHQAGLTVRASLGFPARKESLPAWTLGLGDASALVPAALWRKGADDLSVTRLPSLHDEHFFGPFLEFVSDVFAVLSLYRFPEGPLVGVSVDWGVYQQDLGVSAVPLYASFLQERYPQAGLINIRYHCTFRDFATATSSQGTRVLLDKRPWLAAYDFKFCRERMLEERAQGILALRAGEPLLELLSFDGDLPPEAASDAPWTVVMDPVLLEGDPTERAYPFAPLGLVNPQASGVFRLWEYLHTQARLSGIPISALKAGRPAPSRIVTVAAGRFLSQALVRTLKDWAEGGAILFFPFGLPQYDENLATLEWKPGLSRSAPKPGVGKQIRVPLGDGLLCYPEAPTAPEVHFWKELEAFSKDIYQGATK